jgi:hypothetical protein
MQTENPEEFFDIGVANRKYGRVDRANGAILLEKVREGAVAGPSGLQDKVSPRDNTFATYAQRFGLNRGN